MIKVADLKKYAERVGIKYPPACRSKKMIDIISKAIEVSVEDLEKIIKHVNNKKQFKIEVEKTLNAKNIEKVKSVEPLEEFFIPEIIDILIENLSDNRYEIYDLVLLPHEIIIIDEEHQKNVRLMMKINHHVELKKFRIV